jgi:hypothetical protein
MALPSQIGPPITCKGDPIDFDCLGCFLHSQSFYRVRCQKECRVLPIQDLNVIMTGLNFLSPNRRPTGSGQCGALAPSDQEI